MKSSTFFQKPKTGIAWWAGGLATLAILMMGANSLGLNPLTETSAFPVWIYDMIGLASFIGSILLGIIALTRKRERSWVVWLFMIPILSYVATIGYLLTERWKYSHPAMEVAPTPDASIDRLPVIFDDDGSPDGTTALLFLLSDPQADVRAVSVSYGEAHPLVYIQHLGVRLEQYGYGDIPLGAGQDAPLKGGNRFPDFVRDSANGFWGFAGEGEMQAYPVANSPALIIKTVHESEKPVTILVTGSLTNVALALRMDASIGENIAGVYIMGGAVHVPGNLNDLLPDTENIVAEWNIYVDPTAASEVFASGLDLYLVPLDATNQVSLTQEDTKQWRKGGSISNFAADMYDSLGGAWQDEEIEMWDLVTAELMMNPQHCTFTPLRLEVVTAEGNTQGQTSVMEGEPNAYVCLEPDNDAIKAMLVEVFSKRK